MDAVVERGAHQRLPDRPDRDALYRVRDRHGIHVLVLPTEALGEERLTALLRYRFAQYLALGFVDPGVAFEQGMDHEPGGGGVALGPALHRHRGRRRDPQLRHAARRRGG